MVRLAMIVALCAFAAVMAAAVQDQDESGNGPEVSKSEDIDRRNPRKVRRERGGRPAGPRMQAGGVGIGGGDPLDEYDAFEPLIGEFTYTGTTWNAGGANTFTGAWTNAWALDGYYMETRFDIAENPDYIVFGMTCYDPSMQRYESHFYNSNSATRTFRWGNFDDDEKVLSMESRFSNRLEDESNSRIVFEVLDEKHFTYTGWAMNSAGAWRKTYELKATRAGAEPLVDAADTATDAQDAGASEHQDADEATDGS